MLQVFRLMGMPDKVIAFDELPESLLEGLEMREQSKMPRHWRDFMGTRERTIKIKPYLDTMINKMVTAPPIVEKGPFAYLIDWELNHNKERWQEIQSYVRRNAPRDFRLLDKLEDMAKPLSSDQRNEITLEPEEVVVIPLPKEVKEEGEMQVSLAKPAASTSTDTADSGKTTVVTQEALKCQECGAGFAKKRALRMHMLGKHRVRKPVAA